MDRPAATMRRRFAALILAIGFFAAPAWGAGGMGACSPCCPERVDEPCGSAHEHDAAGCTSLEAASCCEVAPVAPAPTAPRMAQAKCEPPTPEAILPAPFVRVLARLPERSSWRRLELPLRASPSRLSVVLLI